MNISTISRIEMLNGVEDRLRILAGCGIIEINQRLPVDLLSQNRKVLADLLNVQASAWRLPLHRDFARCGVHITFPSGAAAQAVRRARRSSIPQRRQTLRATR